jgi:hypothetical protein
MSGSERPGAGSAARQDGFPAAAAATGPAAGTAVTLANHGQPADDGSEIAIRY